MITKYKYYKPKVSFDFDDTLSLPEVQNFVRKYLKEYDVHIVTSRYKDLSHFDKDYIEMYNPIIMNEEVYKVANELNIKHIHFTNKKPKNDFFKLNKHFLFHLDDDLSQIFDLNNKKNVTAICVQDDNWQEQIFKILSR